MVKKKKRIKIEKKRKNTDHDQGLERKIVIVKRIKNVLIKRKNVVDHVQEIKKDALDLDPKTDVKKTGIVTEVIAIEIEIKIKTKTKKKTKKRKKTEKENERKKEKKKPKILKKLKIPMSQNQK